MTDPQPQPLLPAEPWYMSPVQRAQFGAMVSSGLALGLQLFEVNADIAIINLKIGLVIQLANLGFSMWGMFKRQTSVIAPLTMTAAAAEKKTVANPPMLATDPTLVPAPQQTATMSNTPKDTAP